MSRSSPETETLLDEGRKLLEAYDDAMKSQKMNGSGSNACLIVMANYGDLALGLLRGILTAGHAQTPADTYRETVRKVAAAREKRRAELQEAVVAAHAAFEAIPIGFPLQQNGRTIDHTLLNEAKRLCELALSDTSTDRPKACEWPHCRCLEANRCPPDSSPVETKEA